MMVRYFLILYFLGICFGGMKDSSVFWLIDLAS